MVRSKKDNSSGRRVVREKKPPRRSRESILNSNQLGANVLFACYVATGAASLFGYFFAARLIVSDLTSSAGVDEGNGIVLGMFALILTTAWLVVLFMMARALWRSIQFGYTTKIRISALTSGVAALSGLIVIFFRYGSTALQEIGPGAMAVLLILFAGASLWAFGTNRSIEEDY